MGIAHIAHVELAVTDLEASVEWFTEVFGLYVSDEDAERVYLRAWQDWDHHSLVLRHGTQSGVDHIAWRVEGPDDVAALERKLGAGGVEGRWVAGGAELGHGDAFRFRTPAGVPHELFWEVERHVEDDPKLQSRLPSHPQRYTGRGAAPRRFDHVNLLIDDVAAEQAWLSTQLGIRHNYFVTGHEQERLGSWMSKTNVSHEIALMRNARQTGSHLHHVGYYADSPDQVLRAATIMMDAGTKIEWGPGAHGTSGAIFLYAFEPSGNRIELWTGGFLVFAPDWQPIAWDPETAPFGLEMWSSTPPETYFTYGTALLGKEPVATAVQARD